MITCIYGRDGTINWIGEGDLGYAGRSIRFKTKAELTEQQARNILQAKRERIVAADRISQRGKQSGQFKGRKPVGHGAVDLSAAFEKLRAES